jgi:hypothetical protein
MKQSIYEGPSYEWARLNSGCTHTKKALIPSEENHNRTRLERMAAPSRAEQQLALTRLQAEHRAAEMPAEAAVLEREVRRRAYTRAEAEAAAWLARRAAADPTEFRRTVISIGVMFSLGAALILASFLVPGISWRMQVQCWEAAAVCLIGVGDFVWRHPVPSMAMIELIDRTGPPNSRGPHISDR